MGERMYRQVQQVRDNLAPLERTVREAILADTVEDMTRLGTDAMAMVDQMLFTLKGGQQDHPMGEPRVDPNLVDAGQRQLNEAWSRAESLALAKNPTQVRGILVDVKTAVDLAAAYIAQALGTELEI